MAAAQLPSEPRQSVPSTVVLFLIDNSASLPPLDPAGKRKAALDKIFTFLNGQPHRLILFGSRAEISVDKPELYRNDGQFTDFFFAFQEVEDLMAAYPAGTKFKIIFITDGIVDPDPQEWNLPERTDLKRLSAQRTVQILARLRVPLYVIVVGDRIDSKIISAFVGAANGEVAASAYVQGLSQFFDNNGVLVERFVFRVEPREGLPTIEKVVGRIVAPPDARVEISLGAALLLTIAVLIGIGVRSFPGAGDCEIIDLAFGRTAHLSADRFRRVGSGVPAWSWRGLSLTDSAKDAAASVTLLQMNQEFPAEGIDLTRLDGTARQLVGLSLPALHEQLEKLQKSGNKDEMIYALNLDYAARNFSPARAEKILTASLVERRKAEPTEFLHAKLHLLFDDTLYHRLTEPRVSFLLYGQAEAKRDLRKGSQVKVGRYQFTVAEVTLGGRKDGRLVLAYERVPSKLGLKTLVPAFLQQVLRFRRRHQRVVV